ncbi:RdgB/HAM1 family non-canonical purine NTP pyrophosphatase [Candidatus Fermentibacteria bacterium]|nr:RdgB/HAM1 family non-canonical purine NTP pyrophosphatase [Candidatus Fermentibacteria bacterium]
MSTLVLASANPDKLEEMRVLLGDLEIEVVAVSSLVSDWRVEEDGITLKANASKKAEMATQATGLPSVADDTGLFVRGLGGAPGVLSARYAGAGCSYADNVGKLLRNLRGETGNMRRALFKTVAVLTSPVSEGLIVGGEIGGSISCEPKGTGGFGYDPIFVVDGLGKTFAECSADEKNRLSHRGRALRALKEQLAEAMLSSG